MPSSIKFVLVVAVFVVPLILFVWLLVRWERGRNIKNLLALARRLGLQTGTSIGNRLFEFPSALGVVDGHPVWLGTVSGKRNHQRYILLQVVVARSAGDDTSRVGPQRLELLDKARVASVPYAEIAGKLAGRVDDALLRAARTGALQGGTEIDVTEQLLIRTFAEAGVKNRALAERLEATVHVLAAYAGEARDGHGKETP